MRKEKDENQHPDHILEVRRLVKLVQDLTAPRDRYMRAGRQVGRRARARTRARAHTHTHTHTHSVAAAHTQQITHAACRRERAACAELSSRCCCAQAGGVAAHDVRALLGPGHVQIPQDLCRFPARAGAAGRFRARAGAATGTQRSRSGRGRRRRAVTRHGSRTRRAPPCHRLPLHPAQPHELSRHLSHLGPSPPASPQVAQMAKRSSAAVAAEAAAPARKRGRRSAPQSSADPAGAGAQCDAEPGESEYERQRRLNIKRNQELLDTLGISSALQEVTVVQVGACSTLQSRAVCCSPCARISDPRTHGVSSAARPREGHHCQSRAEKKEQRTRA